MSEYVSGHKAWDALSYREKIQLKVLNKGTCFHMYCEGCPLEPYCLNPEYDLGLANRMLDKMDEELASKNQELAQSAAQYPSLEPVSVEEFLQELKQDAIALLEKIETLEARLANK